MSVQQLLMRGATIHLEIWMNRYDNPQVYSYLHYMGKKVRLKRYGQVHDPRAWKAAREELPTGSIPNGFEEECILRYT